MPWNLHSQNESVQPPIHLTDPYDSQEDAFRAACQMKYGPARPAHTRVLYIEKPDGARIELGEIEEWCEKHRTKWQGGG